MCDEIADPLISDRNSVLAPLKDLKDLPREVSTSEMCKIPGGQKVGFESTSLGVMAQQ